MVILTVSLDTQVTSAQDIRALIIGGQVLHAAGILNTRWDDYSALYMAEQAGLEAVEWDYTGDDTAGALELIILYPRHTGTQMREQLHTIAGVDEVEVSDGSRRDGNNGVPFN